MSVVASLDPALVTVLLFFAVLSLSLATAVIALLADY
jgi:hypothetical protein